MASREDLFPTVEPDDLMLITPGAIIQVGNRIDDPEGKDRDSTVWFVFAPGKAVLVDSHFPYGETEDLDWFKPWLVRILGYKPDF